MPGNVDIYITMGGIIISLCFGRWGFLTFKGKKAFKELKTYQKISGEKIKYNVN